MTLHPSQAKRQSYWKQKCYWTVYWFNLMCCNKHSEYQTHAVHYYFPVSQVVRHRCHIMLELRIYTEPGAPALDKECVCVFNSCFEQRGDLWLKMKLISFQWRINNFLNIVKQSRYCTVCWSSFSFLMIIFSHCFCHCHCIYLHLFHTNCFV